MSDEQSPFPPDENSAPVGPVRRRRSSTDARAASMMVDRLPPNAIEAEQGVLGCILLDPYECIYTCITEFSDGPVVFYDLQHQVIYQTMLDMADSLEAIDTITLTQWLKNKQQLEAVGGVPYLAFLPDVVPSAANVGFYINIVKEKHVLRKMLRACTDVVTEIYDAEGEVDQIIDNAEAAVLAAAQRTTSDIAVQCKPLVESTMVRLEQYYNRNGSLIGLSTGFLDLDRMTTGLRRKNLIVIAARPSMGKTSLAMNIAEAVAIDQREPVGVFSLEMGDEELMERMLSSRARVNLKVIRDGVADSSSLGRLATVSTRVANAPLYIDDTSGLSIMQLRARARRMWRQYGIKLFVVDYMQLMHSTSKKAQSRQQEIGDISRGCKQLAKELDVPVIVLAQLNRGIEKDGKRKPRLSDLRESGDIEQDADIIGLLYDSDDDEDAAFYQREVLSMNLMVGKNRNGPTGDVPLTFFKTYTRFESAARISIPEEQQDAQGRLATND